MIGGGSAGCVVASRLASAGQSVTLLEAGSSDRSSPTDLFVHMPTALAWPMGMKRYNWGFKVKYRKDYVLQIHNMCYDRFN